MQHTPNAPGASRYAPTSWGGSPYVELTTPSGQLCLVRKLQPIDLAAGNMLGASDLLASTVQEQVRQAKAGPQDRKKSLAEQNKENETKIAEALGEALSKPEGLDNMIDTVTMKAVVEPPILSAPRDFADRQDGVVYVDSVSFGDKMFIFNWVMQGIDQMKTFRESTAGDVATLEPGKGVPNPTE